MKACTIIVNSMGYGGTEGHVSDLIYGFIDRNIKTNVIIIAPPYDRIEEIGQTDLVKFYKIFDNPDKLLNDGKFRNKLQDVLEHLKPDFVHLNMWGDYRIQTYFVLQKMKLAVVETLHTTFEFESSFHKFRMTYDLNKFFWNSWKVRKIYYKLQTHFIHISNKSKTNFQSIYPRSKYNNMVYCGAFFPEGELKLQESNQCNIIWIGTLIERKRPLFAVQIINSLLFEFPNIKFTIIGDGPLYKQVSDAIYGNRNIMLYRHVKDLKPFLEENNIMFHTSVDEGIPKNIRYAMNFAIPVVTSNVGAISEFINDGQNGFLFDVKDINRAKMTLRELMLDFSLMEKVGLNGRTTGAELFDMDLMIENVLKLYNQKFKYKFIAENINIKFSPKILD